MTEGRKHATLFATTLLCARKLIESIESDKPNLAKQYFVDKTIDEAALILQRIEKRWPEPGEAGLRILSQAGHSTHRRSSAIALRGGGRKGPMSESSLTLAALIHAGQVSQLYFTACTAASGGTHVAVRSRCPLQQFVRQR